MAAVEILHTEHSEPPTRYVDMTDIWGTVPAWFSAIGTVGTAISVAVGLKTYNAAADERRDNERRQSRMVTIEIDYPGGVAVTVQNRSAEPIYELVIESAQMSTDQTARWRINRGVAGASPTQDVLEGKAKTMFPIEFVDSEGKEFDWHYHVTKDALQLHSSIRRQGRPPVASHRLEHSVQGLPLISPTEDHHTGAVHY
ncbi:hypothetical protein AB0H42_23855 [Nocardia sp. NPDC050799]|uniref:hypothetical protein n=1 Tax=Nocardia sp. NPDC050799 TaxID=3154842 RepID=UPI0033F071B5